MAASRAYSQLKYFKKRLKCMYIVYKTKTKKRIQLRHAMGSCYLKKHTIRTLLCS